MAVKTTGKEVGLDTVMSEFNDKYGEGSIIYATTVENFRNIPSGIFELDYATGGGLIEGQVNAIVGYESSGKSTTSLRVISNCQEKYPDDICAYADFEGSFDPIWAAKQGVDLSRLIVIQPINAEQGINMMQSVLEESRVKFLVVDSLPAMVTEKEVEDEVEKAQMAEKARLIAKFLNKVSSVLMQRRLAGNTATVILLNQWRFKVGLAFGDPRVLPCGEQQKYAAFTRIDLSKPKDILEKASDKRGADEIVAYSEHEFTLYKFKGPKRIRTGTFRMVKKHDADLAEGSIDDYNTVLTYAKKHGLLTGGGQYQKLHGVNEVFKSMADIRRYLIENPLDYIDVKSKLIALYRLESGLPALPPDNFLLRYHDNIDLEIISDQNEG